MKGSGRERWPLVKVSDEFAAGHAKALEAGPESVKSGKTIKQMPRDGARRFG